MLSRAATVGVWAPTNETVTAIATALTAHWLAAKAAARSPFWSRSQNWLDVPRHTPGRVTTSR
jgi:hypothetical protein